MVQRLGTNEPLPAGGKSEAGRRLGHELFGEDRVLEVLECQVLVEQAVAVADDLEKLQRPLHIAVLLDQEHGEDPLQELHSVLKAAHTLLPVEVEDFHLKVALLSLM